MPKATATIKELRYGYTIDTDLSYDDAVTKVTAALKDEGFGVLTEINVKQTMKEKLDMDFRRYVILGACNPHFASKALLAETEIGLLMPCNVVVYERDDKKATVGFLDPKAMFSLSGRDDVEPLANEVAEIVRRIAEAMI